MHRAPLRRPGFAVLAWLAALPLQAGELRDLYFGEAVYHARQGHYFEALQRLDAEVAQHGELDEPERDSLYWHIDDAEFSLGDFELRYRMHHRAGRAITAVLEGDVEDTVRNDAAYRLARIHFRKGQMEDALRALGRIDGRVPPGLRDDIEFLRANVYLATGRSADAVRVLRDMPREPALEPFVAYNLGIALLEDGRAAEAREQLDRSGLLNVGDEAGLAIRDKSNLVLGTMLLEDGLYEEAKTYLDRVRLEGPFSAQALLSSGWADIHAGNVERALVPWGLLAEREVTDAATQEALLALPFAYGKLDVHGRAALYYGEALDTFGAEGDKLDASIKSIREGRFLKALVREEIRQNKDWVMRLRSLPEAPETYYLAELLASHDFHTGLQNYLDLADLKRKLESWQTGFDAFDDIVGIRRDHYTPLLPDIDANFRKLDSTLRLRKEQHRLLEQRVQDLLTAPRPEFLATGEERADLKRIAVLEKALANAGDEHRALRDRVARVKGVLVFRLRTQYDERLTRLDRNLRELHDAVALAEERYVSFVRARQAATHSFEGYTTPIGRLRTRVREGIARVELLMARQGRVIERVAIDELKARRRRLQEYQDQARYALADSYDRATQARAERAFETEGDEP